MPHPDRVTIIDDFLDEASCAALARAVGRLEVYRPPPEEYSGLVWRPGDVPPLLSRDIYRSAQPDANHVFHPLARALRRTSIAGREMIEFSIRLQVGRRGTTLGAHDDGDDRASGGFSFYLNETWDPHWGGLLIAFEPVDLGPRPEPFSLAAMAEWHRGLNRTRFNHAITPRRNRLVLLWHPVRHMVTEILPAAGEHQRIVCTGYFRARPAV
jgi:hypothetical protein